MPCPRHQIPACPAGVWGPCGNRKDPPFPKDPRILRAGSDWDPLSHQYRLGASSLFEGTLMSERRPLRRGPLSGGWALSALQAACRGPIQAAFWRCCWQGRRGVLEACAAPSMDPGLPCSRVRAAPKPSLPLSSLGGFPGLRGAVPQRSVAAPHAKPQPSPREVSPVPQSQPPWALLKEGEMGLGGLALAGSDCRESIWRVNETSLPAPQNHCLCFPNCSLPF